MSFGNRKREYNRIVTSGQVPPEVLIREFGAAPTPKEPVAPEADVNPEPKPKKKKGKR